MGLLKSVDSISGIDFIEYRDCDFYNKYTYRARFYLQGARYAHGHKSVDHFVSSITNHRFYSTNTRKQLTDNLPLLKKFLEWHLSNKDKSFTIRIEGGIVAVYSNDLNFLHDIPKHIPNIIVDYTQAEKSAYVGVKQFVKEPKYKYRVYLKSKRVEQEFANSMLDLLNRNKELYPSSALKFWLNNAVVRAASWQYRWASASHFIDYNDESTISYLALIHGDMLGKRYKLEKRPN